MDMMCDMSTCHHHHTVVDIVYLSTGSSMKIHCLDVSENKTYGSLLLIIDVDNLEKYKLGDEDSSSIINHWMKMNIHHHRCCIIIDIMIISDHDHHHQNFVNDEDSNDESSSSSSDCAHVCRKNIIMMSEMKNPIFNPFR